MNQPQTFEDQISSLDSLHLDNHDGTQFKEVGPRCLGFTELKRGDRLFSHIDYPNQCMLLTYYSELHIILTITSHSGL